MNDPIEFIRRPSGLGLGAIPAPPELMDDKKKKKKNKIKLPGDVERKVGVVSLLRGVVIMYTPYCIDQDATDCCMKQYLWLSW